MNTKSKISIGNKLIGENESCFIIAEIGANHNQDFEIAKRLVDISVEAGVDAVKFQSFTVENWISKDFTEFPTMQSVDFKRDLKKAELSYELYQKILEYCKKRGILCFSTPSHMIDVDKLYELGTPAFKFGAVQITDIPTLKHAAKYNIPMILSAGASNMSEVLKAVEAIWEEGNNNIAILQCTSIYPCTEYEWVNLNVMDSLKKLFDFPIGYSDHTTDPMIVPVAAVAKGAKIFEKHVTLDRNMEGPDHPFALEPNELKQMVNAIRNTEKSLGTGYRTLLDKEKEVARMGRRSIVAKRDIKKGQIIRNEDLTLKRPGYGIQPEFINVVVGRIAKSDIELDRVLTWEMI